MSQSNGNDPIKRFEFVYKNNRYQFVLNPEDYQQTEPNRMQTNETLGGGYIDAFGAGLVDFSIKGTTGFKNQTKNPRSGFEKFVELRDLIREVYKDADPLSSTNPEPMKFYNYTDKEYWAVYPERFALSRNKSKPLLFQYDIKLVGLHKLTKGKKYEGRIGNPFPMPSNKPTTTDGGFTSRSRVPSRRRVFAEDGGYTGSLTLMPPPSSHLGITTSRANSTLKPVLDNLAYSLGGQRGRLSPLTSNFSTQGTTVLQTGDVPSISPFLEEESVGRVVRFTPRFSRTTTNAYDKIVKRDTDFVDLDNYMYLVEDLMTEEKEFSDEEVLALIISRAGNTVDSLLLDAYKSEENFISLTHGTMIRFISIESMVIYHELYQFVKNGLDFEFSESNLKTLAGNILYLRLSLEKQSLVPHNTIKELQSLLQTILLVLKHEQLFS